MQNLIQKLFGARAFRFAEEKFRRVFFDDLAFIQEDHAVCYLPGEGHFVGDA